MFNDLCCRQETEPEHLMVPQDPKLLHLIGWELRVHLFQTESPERCSTHERKLMRGWRNRPMVPRMHTVTKTQRKILSITMATYFQSSSTCERVQKMTKQQKEQRKVLHIYDFCFSWQENRGVVEETKVIQWSKGSGSEPMDE